MKNLLKPFLFILLIQIAQINIFSQTVPITFRVNMSYQIESEQFDPDEEFGTHLPMSKKCVNGFSTTFLSLSPS